MENERGGEWERNGGVDEERVSLLLTQYKDWTKTDDES